MKENGKESGKGRAKRTDLVSKLPPVLKCLHPIRRRLKIPLASAACAVVGVVLYVILAVVQGGGIPVSSLNRAAHGDGEIPYEVLVKGLTGESEVMSVTIPVGERQYTAEEAGALYEAVLPELVSGILGANDSLETVRSDLNLIRTFNPYGLKVRWESDNPDLLDSFGTVHNAGIPETGKEVWLNASLSDGVHEQEYDIRVNLMPPVLTKEDRARALLKKSCERLDRQQQTKDVLVLPASLEGRDLSYFVERETDYSMIPALGLGLAVLCAVREKINGQNKKKRREQLLLLDYSEIISKLMVFIGAGMTGRNAWERIAVGYENAVKKGRRNRRPAYEEMVKAAVRLQSGTPESQAYGEFGRRCGLQSYVKLAALLEQNRKTGSKNLKSALALEMVTAFEQRKNLAKKLGEEAGTKLLLPLFLMLGIVMVMIVVPAFLAFY